MRQGHHGEQLLEAKGKLLFSLFFPPGTGLPAGCSPGSGGLRGSARGRPPRAPRLPRSAEKLLSAAGDRACILPKLLFSPCSGRAALPVAPLPVLRATCPHAAPGRAGSSSVPGSCCSSGRPGRARGSKEAGAGSGCPGSEGPSADHLPLREQLRPPGARPRRSAERRCCKLSPQKADVEAECRFETSERMGSAWQRDRTGPGPKQGFGALGCAGSRSGGAFAGDGRPPRAAQQGPVAAPHPGDDGVCDG